MKYITPLNGDIGDLNRPYIDANPAYGIEGSIPSAPSIEHPMREIIAVIEGAGLKPSADDLTQLLKAITIIVEENIPEMPEIPKIPIASKTLLGIFRVGDDFYIDPITGILSIVNKNFPSGTCTGFHQSAAPTGWVKQTDAKYDNAALRFTTGNVSTGGSVTFSNAFKSQSVNISVRGSVGSATLSISQMPSHGHSFTIYGSGSSGVSGGGGGSHGSTSTRTTGGSSSHTHSLSGASGSGSINLGVKYVDFIVCTKS